MLSLYLCTVDVPYQSYGEADIMKLKEIFAETHTVEIAKKKKDAILRHAQNVLLDRDKK